MNLNQITIPSLDLTKSIPFFEKLRLKLIVKSLPHYARFECPDGNSTFSIHQTENLPKGDGIYVYFEVLTGKEKDMSFSITMKGFMGYSVELRLWKNGMIINN